MSSMQLARLAGVAAILAGLLRIISAFFPHLDAETAEAVYLATDILILFGLIGIYLSRHDTLGWVGFFGFVFALTGTAIIVGTEGVLFGVPEYPLGAGLLSMGLALMALASLWSGSYPIWIPLLWLATFAAGITASAWPAQQPLFFHFAGVLFGASFVAAGLNLLRR